MATFWKVIGALAAIVVLCLAGIPWFWGMASVVGIIWAWSYLQGLFPAHKKKVGLAITVLLVATAFPFLHGFIYPYTQRSEAAGLRRLLYWDLWRAEKMDPALLKSRTELSSHRHWLEDKIGARHAQQLDRIENDRANGLITDSQAWERTLGVENESAEYRRKSARASDRLTTGNSVPNYPFCPGNQPYHLDFQGTSRATTVFIPTRAECWTGPVFFPTDSTGARRYRRWILESPSDMEFALADGTRRYLEGNEIGSGFWPPDNRFYLRGPGPTKITIDR